MVEVAELRTEDVVPTTVFFGCSVRITFVRSLIGRVTLPLIVVTAVTVITDVTTVTTA